MIKGPDPKFDAWLIWFDAWLEIHNGENFALELLFQLRFQDFNDGKGRSEEHVIKIFSFALQNCIVMKLFFIC